MSEAGDEARKKLHEVHPPPAEAAPDNGKDNAAVTAAAEAAAEAEAERLRLEYEEDERVRRAEQAEEVRRRPLWWS